MCSDCDVVIVNYNAGELLSECVGSVLSQGVSKVIVVDNASADVSLECLEQSYVGETRLEIIRNSNNVGFAAGCNLGAKRSSSKYILFLNPDCIAEPDSIGKLLDSLEKHKGVGLVGGLLLNPDGTEQPGGRRVVPTPRRAFIRAFGLSKLGKVFPYLFSDFLLHREPVPESPIEVEAISGACMLAKRSAMDEVGGWDEKYFMHCEDLDWCMRFRSEGWKVFFVPDAKIYHEGGGCSRSRPFFIEWHKHRGMTYFYRKHFKHQYPGILMWLVSGAVWLRFSILVVPISVRCMVGVFASGARGGKFCRDVQGESHIERR